MNRAWAGSSGRSARPAGWLARTTCRLDLLELDRPRPEETTRATVVVASTVHHQRATTALGTVTAPAPQSARRARIAARTCPGARRPVLGPEIARPATWASRSAASKERRRGGSSASPDRSKSGRGAAAAAAVHSVVAPAASLKVVVLLKSRGRSKGASSVARQVSGRAAAAFVRARRLSEDL